MKTAAKVVKLSRSTMPAPAYTDFSSIFIAREATPAQEKILIAHEQAHIWLNHHTRRAPDFNSGEYDRKIWDTALEMEIARCIYTPEDEDEIRKPLTLISGGFVSDSFKKMPSNIILAEDIYIWLKNNPQEMHKNIKFCSCPEHSENDSQNPSEPPSQEEIKQLKLAIKHLAETISTKGDKYSAQKIIKPKPSLASEIDYIFRNLKQKRGSYLRPSRREVEPFILRGKKKYRKRPAVEVYVDRSGSMSGEKTGASIERLKTILSRYRATIKNDVFYFSDGKIYPHDVRPSGGNPYPLVMEQIEKNRPTVAIIITDYDLEETEGLKPLSHRETKILCVPVCAERTAISNLIGAIDVF
jgi:hypothetical protein